MSTSLKKVPTQLLCLVLASWFGVSAASGFSLATYNMSGNGTSDWSTNATQVQAIARELLYLDPDIICFNEIPNDYWWQMTNWQAAWFPNHTFVVSPASDNYIRNGIASRFPITYSHSYLNNASLVSYGYSGTFTRDLFEARISVPDYPQTLHVFVAHLKSGTSSSDDSARRGAEASAVSNYMATRCLNLNPPHPYVLAGDMNEDIAYPATGSKQPIQRLTTNTGLMLTTPVNPTTLTNYTISIRLPLNRRFDYILPGPLLSSNINSSLVFRSDKVSPLPPNLYSSDSITGSDHLPVMMYFDTPFRMPFNFTAVVETNQTLYLSWGSVPGQTYRVESSTNLTDWVTYADGLTATNYTLSLSTNSTEIVEFYRVARVD
jgi:endonuclease/exonuclease/phosphatase family metal-dependent hydrolase